MYACSLLASIDDLLHGLYNQRPNKGRNGNFGVYGPILFKLSMLVAYRPALMICYMAFTIKDQTKAATAFKGNFCVYGPILFKLCMQVAYWPALMICYMAFTIKGQTKAAAAFKVNISVYGPILFKLCMQIPFNETT